jgi:hypothetical protein
MASLPTWLQWWRNRGVDIYDRTCATFAPIHEAMLKKLSSGAAQNCFGRMIMEKQKELGMDNRQAMFISTKSA